MLGARPLRRIIQREIEDQQSEKILFGGGQRGPAGRRLLSTIVAGRSSTRCVLPGATGCCRARAVLTHTAELLRAAFCDLVIPAARAEVLARGPPRCRPEGVLPADVEQQVRVLELARHGVDLR